MPLHVCHCSAPTLTGPFAWDRAVSIFNALSHTPPTRRISQQSSNTIEKHGQPGALKSKGRPWHTKMVPRNVRPRVVQPGSLTPQQM